MSPTLPDDGELGAACDCLKDHGLDHLADVFAALVEGERRRASHRESIGVDKDWFLLLSGFLRGFSEPGGRSPDDHDRAMFRRASDLLLRLVDRDDLAAFGDDHDVR